MALCQICFDLDPRKDPEHGGETGVALYSMIHCDDLRRGAAARCGGCSLLKEVQNAIVREWAPSPWSPIWCTIELGDHGGPLAVFWTMDEDETDWGDFGVELFRLSDETLPWSTIGVGGLLSSDSSSTNCMNLAISWLHECLESHSDCHSMCPILPRRAIYVGFADDELRLEECTGLEVPYAALIYCWGLAQPFTTTISTLRQRMKSIPYSELPKTIQDAVHITRQLRVFYLFVDALCIIQDSKQDWEEQAAQMNLTYARATVTIAAQSSSDCHGGCFHPRCQDISPTRVPIEVKCGDNNSSHVYVRRRADIRKDFPAHRNLIQAQQGDSGNIEPLRTRGWVLRQTQHGASKDTEPLQTRGWVLQESLLPSRLLFFSRDEMAWQCPGYTACECQPVLKASDYLAEGMGRFKGKFIARKHLSIENEIRRNFLLDEELNFEPKLDDLSDLPLVENETIKEWTDDPKLTNDNLRFLWTRVVEEFTKRNLTFPSDRLPAISGLAASMTRANEWVYSPNNYLFGIWLVEMPHHLCWYRPPKSLQPASRLKPDYAPSWSWASVTVAIEYMELFSGYTYWHTQILAATRNLSSANPYGPGSGLLTVNGPLLSGNIEMDYYVKRDFNVRIGSIAENNYAMIDVMSLQGRFFVWNSMEVAIGDPAVILVLVELTTPSVTLKGLILKEVSGTTNKYRRVGFVSCKCFGNTKHDEEEEARAILGRCQRRTITLA